MTMRGYHWGMIVLLLAIGYMVGVYMPGWGMKLRGMIGA